MQFKYALLYLLKKITNYGAIIKFNSYYLKHKSASYAQNTLTSRRYKNKRALGSFRQNVICGVRYKVMTRLA